MVMKKNIYIIALLVVSWFSVVQSAATIYYEPETNDAICQKDTPYVWRNKQFYTTGTYLDSAITSQSSFIQDTTIYTLNLTVHNTFTERKIELRKGSKVEIRGKWYSEPGSYYDTIPSTSGCDSILHLTIIWAECFRQIESQSICYGNSIQWHGKTLSEEGIYWDSLKTAQGYDSVFQIYIYVHYPFVQYDSLSVCESDTSRFFWRGMHIATPGDYHRTYMDQYGCDSTYHLHLIVPQISPATTYTEYFCRNQGFVWPKIGGTTYYEQKSFTERFINEAGCDSLVTYKFIPRERDFHSETIQHYPGTSISWRDSVYVIDSIYQDTLINQYGCDSIIELRLIPKYDLYQNVVRCKGDTAMFHKEIISENCIRHDTLKAVMGGDSICHISYSFKSSFYSREYITICSNEYFEWTGHIDRSTGQLMVLHEEGQYYDRHRNEAGCDSTYEIIVKHSPAWIKDSVVLICKDTNEISPVIWYDSKGKKYEFYPTQYLDTIIRDTMRHTEPVDPHYPVSTEGFAPVTGGCDSIFNFHLIITDRCSDLDSIPMCTDTKGQNIPVIVDGRTYTEPGLYSNKMPSSMHQELLMKDSTHTFRIWIAPKDTSYDTIRWCESRLPAVYNGQNFYDHQTTDHQLHFTNRYGCDSLVNLHIDITPTVYSPIQHYNEFCPGDSIYVKTTTGKIFTQPGEFTDTIPYGGEYEMEGCDSIIRYKIAYKPSYFHTESYYLSLNRETNEWTFNWLNHWNQDTVHFSQDGIYYDSCKNVFGCDSVYQLRLMYPQAFFKSEEEHLCSNQLPFLWRNKAINKPGVYYDSLYTEYKLDSVYQLKVTIDSVYYDTIVKHFCYGDYFYLKGKLITTSGNYNDTLRTHNACDSIFTYAVSFITPIVSLPEEKHIAEGTSIVWHGQTLNQTGYYYDTIRATRILDGGHPCDSILYSLHLFVEKPFYKEDAQHVCSNYLPLIWHNYSINQSGVYWDSCKNVHGVDSVYKLTVTVDPIYSDTIYHHLCHGDMFSIHGQNFTSSGIYRDTLTSSSGCDSIICHIVSFATSSTLEQQTLRCNEGKSVTWHGKEYSIAGVYFDTLRTQWGCDSIYYTMQLIVNHSFFQYDSVTLCNNEFPYHWHNRDLNTAGIYWDSCRTAYQLDSVYKLRIDTLPDYFYSYTHFICPGSSYNFAGRVLTEPGVYIDHNFQQNGCDSTIRCVLNYAPHYFYDEQLTYVNDSELPIIWHGKQLDHEGYYFDSLQTQSYGCDSIHRVYLRKSLSYSFLEEKELCESQLPYFWQGENRTEAGLYTAQYTTRDGLDSIYQLNLIVHPSELTVLNEQICPGANYKLYGKTYTQPGVYRDTMFTEQGCYDITELHLSFYNVITTEVHHQLCSGDSILIDGHIIKQSGTYEETTKSLITGCDSIIRHIVSYHTSFYRDESKTINPGEVYIWHNKTLSESGTYFDSCKNQFGCDSIYRLQLTVNQVEYHFPVEEVTVCEGSLPYVWHSQSFYSDTLATANYLTRLGRDSIYTLLLHVSRAKDSIVYLNYCEGSHPEINGKTYTRSAQFIDTLADRFGCDSLRIKYTINFYPRYSITQLIDLKNGECYHFGEGTALDTLICTSGTYYRHFTTVNGCDSLVTLKVTACDINKDTTIIKDICGNETFTINGQVITESGKYVNYLKTANGCDSIVTYLVNIHKVSDEYRAVSICQGDSYTWTGHFHDTVLTKPGLYIDSVPTPSGCYNTFTLKLSYKSQAWRDTLISLCADKLPYKYKGKSYYVDSTFYDTLGTTVQYGCDSILRWHYEINYHCSPYDHYTRCSNEIKYIEGLLIDHAGVYSVHRLTQQGEDSIYRFIVTDAQPYEHFTTLAPGCDSITYKGKTYYARGAGKESFQVDLNYRSIDGCDSVEHLMLTIYTSSPKYVETATIADFQTYRFENQTYSLPGTYTVHHLNQHNCDSIRELVLTVKTTIYHVPDTFAFCHGNKEGLYIYHKWYYPTQDTIIHDTSWVNGTPHIYTALVNEHYPFYIKSFNPPTDQTEICSNYIVHFDVSYTLADNSAMPEYFDYYFVEQDLEVKHDTISEKVNGRTTLDLHMDGRGRYVDPGYYTFRIRFRSTSCDASNTSFTGKVLVRYPKDVMAANWDNIVTLYNENYNVGKWVFIPPYGWQVYNAAGGDKTAQVRPKDHSQPFLASNHLTDGDQVTAILYREGYSMAVPSCSFTFTTQAFNPATNPILVYPNVTAKSSNIHVQARTQGVYHLYSPTGDKCHNGSVAEGENTIAMPATAGCYLMQISLEDGTTALERVIVY